MVLVVGLVLSLIFLDWPWPLVVALPLAAFDIFEIVVWLRWRKRRSITGAESLVGERGKVVTECRPDGQVRVKGQLWRARCSTGADVGERVEVTALDGMTLEVAPAGLATLTDRAASSSGRAPDF